MTAFGGTNLRKAQRCFGEPNPRSSAPAIELRHVEIFPARHVGHFRERLAIRLGGVDADRRGGAERPRLGRIVDRGIGGAGWDLIDNDPVLLALACDQHRDKGMTLNAVQLDLSRHFEAALASRPNLITISALLDLVSQEWLQQFLHGIAARALPVYAALTYDGRCDLSPTDQLDGAVVSAVNAHQRTDKGFGPALGPSAAKAAIAGFETLGYSVITGESDWIMQPDDREIQDEILAGWANAAREMGTLPASAIADWLTRRKAMISEGRSSMRVGHVDFFAFPSSMR